MKNSEKRVPVSKIETLTDIEKYILGFESYKKPTENYKKIVQSMRFFPILDKEKGLIFLSKPKYGYLGVEIPNVLQILKHNNGFFIGYLTPSEIYPETAYKWNSICGEKDYRRIIKHGHFCDLMIRLMNGSVKLPEKATDPSCYAKFKISAELKS